MKELVLTTMNALFAPGEGGSLRPMAEICIVTSEPRYSADADNIVRERATDQFRFFASAKVLRSTAKGFEKWSDEMESAVKAADEVPSSQGRELEPGVLERAIRLAWERWNQVSDNPTCDDPMRAVIQSLVSAGLLTTQPPTVTLAQCEKILEDLAEISNSLNEISGEDLAFVLREVVPGLTVEG